MIAHTEKCLRLMKELLELVNLCMCQRGEAFLSETGHQKRPGNYVIDLAILIAERPVERQAVHLAFLIHD